MGLATIAPRFAPRSQKEHTEIHKIPKFGVDYVVLTEIQRFNNGKISKLRNVWDPDAVSDSVRTAIHFFVNSI